MLLYLLRHAKSSWGDSTLADEERPLNPRGKQACVELRRHFESIGLRVDLVLCSPARRTRETWAAVAPAVGGAPEVRFEADVYEASFLDLAELVRAATGPSVANVLVVGHNPGTEQLAAHLTGDEVRPVPTGGFVTLEVEPELVAGTARLVDFVRPREL